MQSEMDHDCLRQHSGLLHYLVPPEWYLDSLAVSWTCATFPWSESGNDDPPRHQVEPNMNFYHWLMVGVCWVTTAGPSQHPEMSLALGNGNPIWAIQCQHYSNAINVVKWGASKVSIRLALLLMLYEESIEKYMFLVCMIAVAGWILLCGNSKSSTVRYVGNQQNIFALASIWKTSVGSGGVVGCWFGFITAELYIGHPNGKKE